MSAYNETAGWFPRRSLCLLRLGALRRSYCEVGGMTRSAIERFRRGDPLGTYLGQRALYGLPVFLYLILPPTAFYTAPSHLPCAVRMTAYNETGKRAPPWISKRKRPECLCIRRIAVCAEMTPWSFVLRSLFGSPINNTNRSSRLYSYQGPPGDCHSPGPS